MREYKSGATRDTDDGKYCYEGFNNPLVDQRYAEYMHKHRIQADGTTRDPDNWQKLFGEDHYGVCIDSAFRHFMDWRLWHRGWGKYAKECLEDSLCALIFNTKAYLYKLLKESEQTSELEKRSLAEILGQASKTPIKDKEEDNDI